MDDKNKNNLISCYLKDFFKEKNISQKEIQDGLNVSQQYVSSILNGKKSIGKKIADRLYELYGVDKTIILTGEYPENTTNNSNVNDIKNKPHDEQMAILHKDILELRKENEELKDMVDDLTLKIEISLAPILRHFKLKADTKEKQQNSSSN